MSTDLIRIDEAEEVEETAVNGDSLQEEITSPIIIDITYFVDPKGGQDKGKGKGDAKNQGEEENKNSDQQESQEGKNDDDKAGSYESGEPQQNGDSSVKTETGVEVYGGSDVFVQVQTKDRTLVGR